MMLKVALGFYLLSTIKSLIYFVSPRKVLGKIYMLSTMIGFLFHTGAIVQDYFRAGHFPVTSLHEGMSMLSWSIILIFFLIEYRYKVLILGSFIIPLAFITLLYPAVSTHEMSELSPILRSPWLSVHVTLAFIGDAAFVLAFGLSVMYILQDYQLKAHRFGSIFRRLPSVETIDDINHRIITIGFMFLTLGIISGCLWARSSLGMFLQGDPKEIWSLITWMIYTLLIHGRLTAGWRGRRSAYLAIAGFGVLVFSFLGVNFLMSSYHNPERF